MSKPPPSGPVDETPPSDPRLDVADALTAILLHAEAIGRAGGAERLVIASRRIADNAKRVWRALEELERRRLDIMTGDLHSPIDAKA